MGEFMNIFRIGVVSMILAGGMALSAKEVAARLNYRICVPDKPSDIESMAAKELSSYLERTFTEKIRLNGSDEPLLFSVGFAPEATGFSKEKDGFVSSGFGVFCRGRAILLTGLDDPGVRPCSGYEEGTLLSVYYFLRRYTGLEIYAPDPVHGEKLGSDPELQLPPEDKPVFSFSIRGIGTSFTDISRREMALYARKQLCHNFYWSNANVYYTVLNRWGKRFKDQPEMLGLHRGKRVSISYPYHLPCLTNPEVKEVILKDILEMIRQKKRKDRLVLRIFSDAGFHRCECENCAKVLSDDDYFYGFILSVWDEVKKHYPETRLFLQEKGSSHNSPPSAGDLTGVVVDIASGFPEKVDYRKNQAIFRKWQERGALPTIRLYIRYPMWGDCPIINPHDVAANFRAMKGFAIGQRISDCSFYAKNPIPYAFASLTNYVHVNCLLNADADPDILIRKFCTFMYPGAAEEMIAFYDWMEKRQADLGPWENPYLKCYPYSVLDHPVSLLDAAAEKCTNPFWLNKLRSSFDDFRKKAEKLHALTADRENNVKTVREKRDEFREKFSSPLKFTEKESVFPLCPMHVPLAKVQDSSISVRVEKDRLVFDLTAMEDNIKLLRRKASPARPEQIWSDDCFEVMIAPENQKYPYLQLAINGNGAVMALMYVRKGLTRQLGDMAGQWNSSAEIGSDRWKAELSIPFSLIKEVCPELKGRIGIFRTRVLSDPTPALRGFYQAHYGLDADAPEAYNHHNISRYRPFTISR